MIRLSVDQYDNLDRLEQIVHETWEPVPMIRSMPSRVGWMMRFVQRQKCYKALILCM